MGRAQARTHAHALATGAGVPVDPMRAVAYLEAVTPVDAVAREGRRLERASITLHMTSGNWFAFQLSVMVAFATSDIELLAIVAGTMLLHACVIVIVLRLFRLGANEATFAAITVIACGCVALALTVPGLLFLVGLQAVLLAVRAWLLSHAVTQERIWLC